MFNHKYLLLFFLVYACNQKKNYLDITNKNLILDNEIMIYKDEPFTGVLFSKVDTLTTYSAYYLNGKKHGKEEKFFYNGKLAVIRHYTYGKKTGTHKAWWNNNQLKFIENFDQTGNHTGTQREWYSNGQIEKEFNFINGKEVGSQKKWDFEGKIKTNYLVINGESFGLIGYEKCKSGDYVD